jgi:ADP-L-glycero-D-manno-heptose 6-epimerase
VNFKNKIVVTGSQGFVGNNLLNQLDLLSVPFIKIDYKQNLTDTIMHPDEFLDLISEKHSPVSEARQIIHLGAYANAADPRSENFQKQNTEFSYNLVKFCSSKSVPMIFASSAAVYGSGNPLKVISPYAKSKLATEEAILASHSPNIHILRLFNIWGSGEFHKKGMMSIPSRFSLDALKNRKIEIWTKKSNSHEMFEQSRDFIHVSDVVKVLIRLINFNSDSTLVMDVGCGESITYLEIARRIAKEIDSEILNSPFPENINLDYYQFYTKANTDKLLEIFPNFKFADLDTELKNLINGFKLHGRTK